MTTKYDFEDGMQFEILCLLIKDTEFCGAVDGLIKPEYFESDAYTVIAKLSSLYYSKYKKAIDYTALIDILRKAVHAKKIRKDVLFEIGDVIKKSKTYVVRDREYIMDSIAEFARQRAMEEALAQAASILSNTADEKRFDKVDTLIKKANDVGLNLDTGEDDYFAGIERRTEERIEESKTGTGGVVSPQASKSLTKRLHIRDGVRKSFRYGWGHQSQVSPSRSFNQERPQS